MLYSVIWFLIFWILHDVAVCAAKSSIDLTSLSIPSKNITTGATLRLEEDVEPTLSPPESVHLKPRIINFNIMVAGLSGLGKTTLCEALLESWQETPTDDVLKKKKRKSGQTLEVQVSPPLEWHDVAANTILRVRIIDTPGFGNKINHQNSVQTITGYIQKCRLAQLHMEQSTNPSSDEERLVHVCLYFLSPGRFLEIDRHFLRHVHHEIPIVPIIAKADTLTNEEIAHYRAMLRRTCQKEKIKIYDFDENSSTVSKQSANESYNRGRRKGEALAIIARDANYPWGKARSFDPNHSDLKLIRDLLLSEHTERFLEKSKQQYMKYRARRMKKAKIVRIATYVAVAGVLAGQVALTQGSDPIEAFKSFKKVMSSQVGRILSVLSPKKEESIDVIESAPAQDVGNTNSEADDNNQQFLEKSLFWYPGKKLGLFGTPLYKESFSTKP